MSKGMAIMDNPGEQEVARLWELLHQLAEQTQHHRNFTANLHVQASGVKVRSVHLFLVRARQSAEEERNVRIQAGTGEHEGTVLTRFVCG